MNILAIGDVVSEKGIEILSRKLRGLKKDYCADFTVVNGENASGVGLTPAQADDIFAAGADVITLGNHTWRRREILDYLDDCRYILRPANFAPLCPGRGDLVFEVSGKSIRVINLIGRCGMDFGPDNPFLEINRILKKEPADITLLDFHCEATSEKLAMAYCLDGRISAMWGTHTHVQTSDEQVFPGGMGYITDIGMTGPVRSVIGIEPSLSIGTFMGEPPMPYKAATGPCKVEGAVFTIDAGGYCTEVRRVRRFD